MAQRKRTERRPQTDNRRPTTDEVTEPRLARGELSDALPDGWEVVAVRDTYIFTQKPRDLRYGAFSAIPFVPMDLIPFRKIAFNNYVLKKPDELTSGTYFEAGDILLPKITPSFENGKQGIIPELPNGFGIATTEVIPIKQIEGVSDAHFLFYYLLKDDVRASLAGKMEGSTGRQRLSKSVVENLEIPLPPLPEQRAIARVLSTLQRAIETQDKLITASRQVKKALMRHLFTHGAVPPAEAARVPLKETEIGAVPEAWEVTKLGDVCDKPQYGYTESATTKPVGPKFLRITDIQDGGVNWPLVPYCEISESFFEKYALKDGDLVVARIGATTGKSYFISNPPRSVFASYLIRVRAKMKLSPEYLRYFANTENYWKQINESKGGRLKQGINLPILTGLRLQLPPIPEQRTIARILAAVDQKIATEEKRKAALQTLFKTTLHQLMTGQMRVKAEG